jgi:CHAT domain-containing protein
LADGDLVASLRLADGQRFTPNDLLRVQSQVGTVICSACDIAVLGGALGAASTPWPLAAVRAGVGNVVAAAWPVDDAAAVLLMTRFHQQWRQRDLSSALAAAAQWLHICDRDELDAHMASLEGGDAAALAAEIAQRNGPGGDLNDARKWACFALYCA